MRWYEESHGVVRGIPTSRGQLVDMKHFSKERPDLLIGQQIADQFPWFYICKSIWVSEYQLGGHRSFLVVK